MDIYIQIEKSLEKFLSGYNFVIDEMGTSPRSIGDKVQEVITKNFPDICREVSSQFKTDFTRRSFEDVAFTIGDKYFAFDVKTKNVEAGFHMPNIKSVERLIHFYASPNNIFIIVSAEYQLNRNNQIKPITFKQISVFPIEQISWSCLRFGKLGYGQLQIDPGKSIMVNRGQTRGKWMNIFFEKLILFYKDELKKSRAMLEWAQRCKDLWENGKIDEISRLGKYIRESNLEYRTPEE